MSYKQWTSQQLVQWILRIDASFVAYQQSLSSSFADHGVSGASVDDLDREDLKQYGIINLQHRKTIYSKLQNLIANEKKRLRDLSSLSDDEDADGASTDKFTNLTELQWSQLEHDGYCMLGDLLKNETVVRTVAGFIRSELDAQCVIQPLVFMIVKYYYSRYNPSVYVQIGCHTSDDAASTADAAAIAHFLVPKQNLVLSNLLMSMMQSADSNGEIVIEKVRPETMHHVLSYLGHHKGVKPEDIAKPIRSTHMRRICADVWDADFVDNLSKKIIFQMILAANYLDCEPLLHLGSAKIATLIKGKSPEEIKQILSDK